MVLPIKNKISKGSPSFFKVEDVPTPILGLKEKRLLLDILSIISYLQDQIKEQVNMRKVMQLFEGKKVVIGDNEYIMGWGVDDAFVFCIIKEGRAVPINLNKYLKEVINV